MILNLLLSGDKYGYQITKLIYANSGENYELKEATMYSSLKRLEKEGNITSYWGDANQGGRRKYYKITPIGEKTYKQNKRNWEQAKFILEKLL
ncbi:PadR family transcriptional regulator [Virgibacillus oceani]